MVNVYSSIPDSRRNIAFCIFSVCHVKAQNKVLSRHRNRFCALCISPKTTYFWTHIAKMWAPGHAGSLCMSTFMKWFHLFRDIYEQYRLRPDAAWSPNKPREHQWRMIPRRIIPVLSAIKRFGSRSVGCLSCVTWVQTVYLCQVPTNEGQHKSKWKSIHVDASYASSLTTW